MAFPVQAAWNNSPAYVPIASVEGGAHRAIRKAVRLRGTRLNASSIQLHAMAPRDGRVALDQPQHRIVGLERGKLALGVGEIKQRIRSHPARFQPLEHRRETRTPAARKILWQ